MSFGKKLNLNERLEKGVVLCAEGYLFELERRCHLKAGPFVPEVVLDNPEALKQVHREFLAAGSDVIEAFTYYGDKSHMERIGRLNDYEQLNRQSIRLAKEVADEGNALVAGNICNTWDYDPKDKASHEKVKAIYEEQVIWAKEEGADFIIAETLQNLGEGLLAVEAIKKAKLPAVVMFGTHNIKSDDGYKWDEACKIVEENGADVVGLNCTRGPATMLPLIENIRKAVKGNVAALPVPYIVTNEQPTFQSLRVNGEQVFPVKLEKFLMDRDEMAEFTLAAKEMGVNFIGVCCGGQPYHVRSMAEALGRNPPASRYSPDFSEKAVGSNLRNFRAKDTNKIIATKISV